MELQPSQIEVLLTRYVAGETTGPEAEQVRHWATLAPENQGQLEEMIRAWEQMDVVDPVYMQRTDAAWEHFRQSVSTRPETGRGSEDSSLIPPDTQPGGGRLLYRRFSIAAAILVLFLIGGIWWLQRETTAIPTQIVSNEGIGIRELALQDGSALSLKTHAKVLVPQSFTGRERKVELLAGEAFFSVAKDSTQPFVVAVEQLEVAVLGTQFEVSLDSLNGNVRVNVLEGKVALRLGQEALVLLAGQEGRYEKASGTLHRETRVNPNQLAWKTRKLIFQRTPLRTVLQTLREVYAQPIQLANPALNDCIWTANFEGASLDEILLVLTQTMNWELDSPTDTIILKGANCR